MKTKLKAKGVYHIECYQTKVVKRTLKERLFSRIDYEKHGAYGCVGEKNTAVILKNKWVPFMKNKRVIIRKKWETTADNLVVNQGLQNLLDNTFGTYYVGLTASSPSPAAGDTMASHAGWTEFTNYDEAARQLFNSARTAQTESNSANKAVFTCSSDSSTIGGSFLATNSTKGGSTGDLFSCAAFDTGDKSADDDDVINVQYDVTASDDGA
jgi:hypothetical protein